MDKKVLDWLLQGPAWLKYAAELQLSGNQPDVAAALQDSSIQKRLMSQRFTVKLLEPSDPRYQLPYITGLLPAPTADEVISSTVGGDTTGSL